MYDLFSVPHNFFSFREFFGLPPSKRKIRRKQKQEEQKRKQQEKLQKAQQEAELLKPWHIKLFQTMVNVYEQTNPASISAPEGVRVGLAPGETVRICYSNGNRLCEIHHQYERRWFKLYPTNTYTVTIEAPAFGQYYQEYSDPEQVRYLRVLFDLFRYGKNILPTQKQTLLELKNIKSTPIPTKETESLGRMIDYLCRLCNNKTKGA